MPVTERSPAPLARRSPKRVSRAGFNDGCIKAEMLKGARIVMDSISLVKLPKGAWLELTKTKDGRGMLLVWNRARDRKMLAIPLSLVKRVYCPKMLCDKEIQGSSFTGDTKPLSRLFSKRGRVFELEGTISGGRIHATFLVEDPEGWVAAIVAPEWRG